MTVKVCLIIVNAIIVNAICVATTDSKVTKILGVLAIALMSISFLVR